jgi:hypothetical protein
MLTTGGRGGVYDTSCAPNENIGGEGEHGEKNAESRGPVCALVANACAAIVPTRMV